MKKMLHIKRTVTLLALSLAIGFGARAQVEWRLTNALFSALDPDGAGPATGTVTFDVQIHTTGATIPNIIGISTGYSWQSANALLPTGVTCGSVSIPKPSNITMGAEFGAAGFIYNNVDQCSGTVNFTAGGQTFDRRASGTVDGGVITLTPAWLTMFTVTLWSRGIVFPQAGYTVINSGADAPNTPPGIVFPTYAVGDPEIGYPAVSLTYTTPLPLGLTVTPVTFSKYDVKCSETGTSITWTTSNEQNSSYFEIQRSDNSSGTDWRSIGRISAAGNSSRERNYQYLDLEAGTAAYRIKQVDVNGRTTYTDIKRSSCEARALNVALYPVPAKTMLTVAIRSDRPAKTSLQVIDATGRVVYKLMNAVINTGSNNIQLDVHSLPAGEYILVSSDPSVYIRQKFIIAR